MAVGLLIVDLAIERPLIDVVTDYAAWPSYRMADDGGG